jgi:hypothetical protein
VSVLIHAADLYCSRVGLAATEAALSTVVVPGVTAEIVVTPTPIDSTVSTVPIGYATAAFVGILNATGRGLVHDK